MKLLIICCLLSLPSFAFAEDLLGLVYNDQGFIVQFADSCVTKDAVTIHRSNSVPVQITLVPYHSAKPCKSNPNGTQISFSYAEIGSGPNLFITNPIKPGVMIAK